jgi:hypothetical protein
MSGHPWIKFYPSDWRADQALRVVSLAARGLWMEMLCLMHEATPYGHLLVGDQPVSGDVLARLAGASPSEIQALLVELQSARVFRQTRAGVIYSKRMTDDYKKAVAGRKAKLEAIEKAKGNRPPSRSTTSPPSPQKPDARAKDKGPDSPLSLSEEKNVFLGPKEIREAFASLGEEWCRSYIDPCAWQDVPERALIPANGYAASKIIREARAILAKHNLTILGRAA